ncbi:MAG: hypothetical protein AB7I33_16650 [Gemmatimonadales bacterium]
MRRFSLALLLLVVPGTLWGQSSIFGIRGLGLPGRGLSARAWAMGGAPGLIDGQSQLNPAAVAMLPTMTAGFEVTPQWRNSTTPAGSASLRSTEFPLFQVAGPIGGTHASLGLSYSNYTSRDFLITLAGTEMLRGTPVGYVDTLSSDGGINDLRLAAAYALSPKLLVGGGFHLLTGVNRMAQNRAYEDTSYRNIRQTTELSYAGWGVSAGLVYQATSRFTLAASLRSDGKVTVDQDSTGIYSVDLPYRMGLAAQYQFSPRLLGAAQFDYRTWSGANSDLLVQGQLGAKNVTDISGGIEWVTDPRRPGRRPLRAGIHYRQLPFLVGPDQPTEFSLSLGTGMSFAANRGNVDLGLERVWRSAGADYDETGWQLVIGLTVRPNVRSGP